MKMEMLSPLVSLKPGEKLILRVNPLKDGRKGGALESFRPEAPDAP